ncbi:hypothetical protein RRG08_047985 [Elysia crispata]|uniref:Uncharacterized protein n=1 Tax=Elysia crispata TaxID=231223 RepID=A0AAE0ZW90_9GAST|nr:hypothetical protein RRG08_047985 [Elysia crispata]
MLHIPVYCMMTAAGWFRPTTVGENRDLSTVSLSIDISTNRRGHHRSILNTLMLTEPMKNFMPGSPGIFTSAGGLGSVHSREPDVLYTSCRDERARYHL